MEKEIQLAPILPRVSIICWYMNIYKYRWKLGYYGLKGHQPMGTVPKSSQHLGYQWIIRWGAHWVPQALGNSILSSWGFPIFPTWLQDIPLSSWKDILTNRSTNLLGETIDGKGDPMGAPDMPCNVPSWNYQWMCIFWKSNMAILLESGYSGDAHIYDWIRHDL